MAAAINGDTGHFFRNTQSRLNPHRGFTPAAVASPETTTPEPAYIIIPKGRNVKGHPYSSWIFVIHHTRNYARTGPILSNPGAMTG
jgi:hypothetical protein